ncbi:MAG: hypothetical protein WBS14_19470, partial [Rhodomicrobium sp.]
RSPQLTTPLPLAASPGRPYYQALQGKKFQRRAEFHKRSSLDLSVLSSGQTSTLTMEIVQQMGNPSLQFVPPTTA